MARALLLTAAALGTLAATAAGAQPSPYAAAGDRYGPTVASAPAPALYGYAAAAPQASAPLRGRMLVWPGKVDRSAGAGFRPPQSVAAANPGWAAYPARAAYVRPTASTQAYRAAPVQLRTWAPPVRTAYAPVPQQPQFARAAPPAQGLAGAPTQGWRPVFADRAPAPASAPAAPYPAMAAAPVAAPAYSPAFAAARAAPPNRAMGADRRYGYDPTQDHAVRFYSVARPFGLKPDPAPIPPQFFTASADLSGGDPPGPLPVNHTTAATRAAVVGGSDAGSQ